MDTKRIVNIILFLLFLIFIIYIFYYLIINYRNTSNNEPWLVKNTKIARTPKIIPGYILPFSNDSKYGMEFSYTFWIYITDWTYKNNEYKHIFHKGSNSIKPLMQGPGVWLYPNDNKMAINMNTFNSIKETCDIDNLPVGKWFHISIILIENNLDIYLNSRLKRRCKLKGVPKQNYGDLYINMNNGFDGFLSKFKYFNYAIPYWRIEQAFLDGPSQQPCEGTGLPSPPYLANDYWMETNNH